MVVVAPGRKPRPDVVVGLPVGDLGGGDDEEPKESRAADQQCGPRAPPREGIRKVERITLQRARAMASADDTGGNLAAGIMRAVPKPPESFSWAIAAGCLYMSMREESLRAVTSPSRPELPHSR
jgi:hypothetical protein